MQNMQKCTKLMSGYEKICIQYISYLINQVMIYGHALAAYI